MLEVASAYGKRELEAESPRVTGRSQHGHTGADTGRVGQRLVRVRDEIHRPPVFSGPDLDGGFIGAVVSLTYRSLGELGQDAYRA